MAAELRRVESSLEADDGALLFRRSWLPPEPRRALLVIHGLAEHSGRYENLGAWFAERGSAVHAFDHRGHGRSDGTRGHVDRFDRFLDDVAQLVESVQAEHPDLPLSLVGHSMGGLILAAFLRERQPAVRAAISSGAALKVSAAGWQLRAAGMLRRVTPRLAISAGLPLEGLSRDPEVVAAYVADPLVFDKLTVSLASELFAAVERTAGGAETVGVPLLVMHGEDDSICAAAGSRDFHAGLRSEGSDLRVYPGLRHEIFNEPEAEQVYADALEWLEKQGA